jgi:hypothetical protein
MGDRSPNRISAQARAGRMLCLAGAVVALGWATAGAAHAAATRTVAFTSPGQHTFTVPAGVNNVTVIAIGGRGGACLATNAPGGGKGAALTATVAVSAGEQLSIGVAGPGGDTCPNGSLNGGPGGAAGIGGGGAGGGATGDRPVPGGGGGGASLVGTSAGFPGPLVVAGGGGGATVDAPGGDAGSPGGQGVTCNAGEPECGQGGAGTLTSGGAGGFDPQRSDLGHGGAGGFGVGGDGAGCGCHSGGGGGGGGYYGGGGGLASGAGGGGGGSSFVVPGGKTLLGPTPTSSAPAVSITYPAPTAVLSTDALTFTGQPPGTASPEQILTVSNKGSAPLIVSGVQGGGAQPDDFLINDRCQQPVAVGSSCQVGVRFDPQASGARSATLTLLTNASHGPKPVALAGTGTGVSGPARPPTGTVAMISCDPVRVGTTRGEPLRRPMASCARTEVSGKVMFSGAGPTRATIARGHVAFAVGVSTPAARGGSLLVLKGRRPLKRGTYTLILRHRLDRRSVSQQMISIVLG